MLPGCIIQFRMLNSAKVTPRDVRLIALLDRTWPRNVTNVVTNDNSINLAKSCVMTLAVEAVIDPLLWICRPYLGATKAMIKKIAEKTVENIESSIMVTASQ